MSAWRREFLARFPSRRSEAEEAISAYELIQRPLFFVLKNAIDQGNVEVISNVITYVRWLEEHHIDCTVAVEEDLLGPITDSERLAEGFLGALTESQYKQLEKYFVMGWQSPEVKAAKLQRLRRQFEDHPFRSGGADAV